ncbi:hypothetical protein N7463_004828 [Penicillium fimorum]|uniref:Uncharacterized protein n=1 Tax=Penicillium fimorum TaxID=1882269 RepID=A0A9W9XRE5_9EURO|nr:hypothetical protein N7463_004828 [Penicillium fimorum]
MTRWINLGSGLRLDDPRWRVNEDSKYMDLSPRHTFEALTDTSLENLTSRNISYLENQRYQTMMVPIPNSASPSWVLWNGAAAL